MKLTIFILVFGFSLVFAQVKNPCIVNSDCGTCLRSNGQCMFCKDEDFTAGLNSGRYRCDYESALDAAGCKNIMKFRGSEKSRVDGSFTDIVQVRPQKVSLELRPAQTVRFQLKVRPAKNFPVHLYYLMDMSKSMEDDLGKLRTLGTQIAAEIKKITENYKLAFGSFVDKTVAPFVQLAKIKEPCKLADKTTPCVETFDYKHVFDFSSDATKFQDAVKQQKISGNLDTPEGGFDGLMQVAVCNKTLKWDPVEKARRIVVFVTDASPHIGGDGRIGGILKPNDAQCHLKDGTYSEANNQDYPSLSLLREKLEENNIIPIMAVTENVQAVYGALAKEWSNLNAAIGTLEGDSSNIVDLIREKYKEIKRTVRPSSNADKDITVRFKTTNCEDADDNDAVCSTVEDEKEYTFNVSVTVNACPAKKEDWNKPRSFKIKIPGFGVTDVEVKMKCECDCETNDVETNSKKCTGAGTFKCGICYCDEGRYGEKCNCDASEQADDTKCQRDGNTEIVCSGQGSCICGKCACNKRPNPGEFISGKYCECNNFGCDRFNGKLCGGEDRGTCECGKCKCKEAFLGDNCGQVNCTIGKKKCIFNGIECSNNGKCDCDSCICNKGYRGQFCEECVSCPGKCSKLKDCVLCEIWNEGPLAKDNCDTCKHLDIITVNDTRPNCEYQDENDCWFHFNIEKNANGNETVLVKKEKRCVIVVAKPTPILAIVLGIIGGLILLALILLLLWKLLITAYDNYEYQKFMKENQNPNWANTNNPIYKPSQTNYQNPTYAGK